MSFDFSYTNARGIGPLGAPEEGDQAQIGAPDEGGALWLIAVCSETGYLMGLPLRSKNQTSLIAHEVLAFTQLLGHEKVTYYADNEPATRQVLKLLVQARTAIGLETNMRTTKLYDLSGNSLAENAVQRIRGVAASLMEEVATQTGLRFSAQHPLWSWCCRRSAWVLNRFQATQGTTSYELVYGRPYEGKVCRYGKVHAYVKTLSPTKNSKHLLRYIPSAAAPTSALSSASAELRLTDFCPLELENTTVPFTMWIAALVDLR